MAQPVAVAVVGLGYWGPKVVRNILSLDGCEVAAVFDTDAARTQTVRRTYPSIRVASSWKDILSDRRVQAVIIATPVASHYELARSAMLHGKDVLVEKPMTQSPDQARELVEIAQRQGQVLMVGHTYVHSAPVGKVRELIAQGDVGEALYVDSVRANLGIFRSDTNVLYDLVTHDFSILDFWLPDSAIAGVRCIGIKAIRSARESLAYVIVRYEDGCVAHIHVNWLSPVKIRRIILGGTKRMVVYDDTQSVEQIKVYDSGVVPAKKDEVDHLRVQYRTGDIWSPRLETREALAVQCENFIESVRKRSTPRTDALSGLRVVRMLHAAQRSLDSEGSEIRLDEDV